MVWNGSIPHGTSRVTQRPLGEETNRLTRVSDVLFGRLWSHKDSHIDVKDKCPSPTLRGLWVRRTQLKKDEGDSRHYTLPFPKGRAADLFIIRPALVLERTLPTSFAV